MTNFLSFWGLSLTLGCPRAGTEDPVRRSNGFFPSARECRGRRRRALLSTSRARKSACGFYWFCNLPKPERARPTFYSAANTDTFPSLGRPKRPDVRPYPRPQGFSPRSCPTRSMARVVQASGRSAYFKPAAPALRRGVPFGGVMGWRNLP